MEAAVQGSLHTTVGEGRFCLLHVSVTGGIAAAMDAYCRKHKVKRSSISPALVSDLKELGSWGRGAPFSIFPSKSNDVDAEPPHEFIGQTIVPVSSLEQFSQGMPQEMPLVNTGTENYVAFTCRLLLAAADGTIEATDNLYSYPYPMKLTRVFPNETAVTSGKKPSEVVSIDLNTMMLCDLDLFDKCEEVWKVELDLDTLRGAAPIIPNFCPVRVSFPFLRHIPPFSPSEKRHHLIHSIPGQRAQDDAVQQQPADDGAGALLSLSIYAHDPSRAFDYNKWFASLPESSQRVVEALSKREGATQTANLNIKSVNPIEADRLCWCDSHLPVAAPVQKRMDAQKEQRKKEAVARSTASRLKVTDSVIPEATSKPPTETKSEMTLEPTKCNACSASAPQKIPLKGEREDAAALSTTSFISAAAHSELNGWCVKPLRKADAIELPGVAPPQRSQAYWNIMVRCASLENHALQVVVESFALGNSGELITLRGATVIMPHMLQENTTGTLHLPVCCTSANTSLSHSVNAAGDKKTSGTSVWTSIFIQYAVIFPFNHDFNDLRVIRSTESYRNLTIPTLVGHRGLGKTYTRGRKHGQTSKLAENSIEALNAAHRRGCDMVEFDVMLTLDRVPVIIHDPIVQLQARDRRQAPPLPPKEGTPVHLNANRIADDREFRSTTQQRLRPQLQPITVPNPQLQPPVTDFSSSSNPMSGFTSFAFPRPSSVFGLDNLASPSFVRGLQRTYLDEEVFGFTSIAIAVHQLTKRQLDAIITESCDFTVDRTQPRLKTLIIRHWGQILRIYRNRNRLQCMRDHSLLVVPDMRSEFRGCDALSNQYQDPTLGLVSSFDDLRKRALKETRFLRSQVDITNYIPALRDLFELTPSSLRLNIEVKYPFMPVWDSNLFLQRDFFEINGFTDAVLKVVFDYAEEGREVAFSSFDPDICIALASKQGRYDVLFLCDTEEKSDLKDYRSFYLEGAIQFADVNNLSGISICSSSLCSDADKELLSSLPTYSTPPATWTPPTEFIPIRQLSSLFENDHCDIDMEYGTKIVSLAHQRGLKVWTWGDGNNSVLFSFLQAAKIGVDAVITDNIPSWLKGPDSLRE